MLPTNHRATREKWIRQKYDAKEWADPSVIQKVDLQQTDSQKVPTASTCTRGAMTNSRARSHSLHSIVNVSGGFILQGRLSHQVRRLGQDLEEALVRAQGH